MNDRAGVHAPSAASLLRGNFWLLFGGIFLVAGLLAAVIGAGLAWEEGRFASEGRTVVATVLGKEIDPGDSDEGTEYFVNYRFTDDDGAVHDGSSEVPFSVYDAAREGGPIEVRFLATDPGESEIVGASELPSWVVLAIAALVLAIGAAVTLIGWRAYRKARRLWAAGTPTTAEVLGVEETNVQINRRQMFRVRYRYTDASGVTHEGASGHMSLADALEAAEGGRGAVLYDPQRPAESIWVGGEATGS